MFDFARCFANSWNLCLWLSLFRFFEIVFLLFDLLSFRVYVVLNLFFCFCHVGFLFELVLSYAFAFDLWVFPDDGKSVLRIVAVRGQPKRVVAMGRGAGSRWACGMRRAEQCWRCEKVTPKVEEFRQLQVRGEGQRCGRPLMLAPPMR